MINAKQELLEVLKELDDKTIKCAIIDTMVTTLLKVGYNKEDLETFFNSLDFIYDEEYGIQYISGTVWFHDNTWLSRGEYDGLEWWQYDTIPPIPEELLNN